LITFWLFSHCTSNSKKSIINKIIESFLDVFHASLFMCLCLYVCVRVCVIICPWIHMCDYLMYVWHLCVYIYPYNIAIYNTAAHLYIDMITFHTDSPALTQISIIYTWVYFVCIIICTCVFVCMYARCTCMLV